MMKQLLITLILFMFLQQASAQKNALFFELGGLGTVSSINYERQLSQRPGLNFRLGLGYLPEIFNEASLTIPFALQYAIPIGTKDFMEFGIGNTLILSYQENSCGLFYLGSCDEINEKGPLNLFFLVAGYRRHFGADSRWFWKAQFTPTLGRHYQGTLKIEAIPWFGLGIGKQF